MSSQALQSLFSSLWTDYVAFNPGAKKIYDLILARERAIDPSVEALVNDHVALRTYDVAPIGLEAMSALFQKHGYEKRGDYVFDEKKLFAWHLEHEDTRLPKVFISQLETAKLSPLVQETARLAAKSIEPLETKKESFLWSRRKWKASHTTYQKLLAESEYAAWLYAFGFRSNHFTISFNHLKSFKDLRALGDFVKAAGFAFNTAGGETTVRWRFPLVTTSSRDAIHCPTGRSIRAS